MDALLNENKQLKDKLLMNETAIQFIEKYTKQFSSIYDKVMMLIQHTSQDYEKQVIIRDNAIQHIKNILDTLYNENISYESKFGAMIVNEIKNNGEHFIMKLSGCLCKNNTSMIMFEAPLMIEHQIESPHQDVDNIIELIEDLKVDELNDENENDGENDENSSQVEVIEIPESRVTTKSFDDTFLDNMQEQFLEYANRKHKKTISKILENKKVEDKELVRLIDSFNKAHPEFKNKIKKYEKQRNNKEEHVKEILKAIYNEKYGDKYKRKMDQTNFENPHFEKWMKKQMFVMMVSSDMGYPDMEGGLNGKKRRVYADMIKNPDYEGLREDYEGLREDYEGLLEDDEYPRKNNKKTKLSQTLQNKMELEPLNDKSWTDKSVAFNYLLNTIDIFDTDYCYLEEMYEMRGMCDRSEDQSIMDDGMFGGKPILDNKNFEQYYDSIRLLSDMKHDFGKSGLFEKVSKIIPPLFKSGILSEPRFIAKVIGTKFDFYENLYIRDATRKKYVKEGDSREVFDKATLGSIKNIVCDMPLGEEYHIDTEDPDKKKLQRIYTYGNHLDPSPVRGVVTDKYMTIENYMTYLNEIINKFFQSCFLVIDPPNQNPNKYQALIPVIQSVQQIENDMGKYRFQFQNSTIGLNGTDFEINSIVNNELLSKLPQSIQDAITRLFSGPNGELKKLLYLMTYKELGDHIQLHELKKIRENIEQPNPMMDTIFGTRDQILIADAFKQNEPIMFWFDSVDNKFTPGIKLVNLDDLRTKSPISGKGSFKSILFYYSKFHKNNIDLSTSRAMKQFINDKLNRYLSVIQKNNPENTPLITSLDNLYKIDISGISDTNIFEIIRKKLLEFILYLYDSRESIETLLQSITSYLESNNVSQLNNDRKKNYMNNIQVCMRILDISFETLSQYYTIKGNIKNVQIQSKVDQRVLQTNIQQFIRTSGRSRRSSGQNITQIFTKLKSIRTVALNMMPEDSKYNQHLSTIFNELLGFNSPIININQLIKTNAGKIKDKFGSIQVLMDLDDSIHELESLIESDPTLNEQFKKEQEQDGIFIIEYPDESQQTQQQTQSSNSDIIMYEAEATPLSAAQTATSSAQTATSSAQTATSSAQTSTSSAQTATSSAQTATEQNQSTENPEELPIHPVQKLFPKFNEYDESFQNLLLINLFPEVQKALNYTYTQELQKHITYTDSLS
uniref:Uncharacterized protein n=1 Tax=viral metagenome TaxID=1070528 RepID=A0A6C0CSR4_9ZZZZ